MSKGMELITAPQSAEMLNSFFKLVFLVKKKTEKVGEQEIWWIWKERRPWKNTTDKEQKRIIPMYEHVWNQPIPFVCNGGENYGTVQTD